MSNEIHFIDEYTSITCPAKIVPDKLNGGCYVQLSAAYCQYLWLVCDIALKTIDCDIILQECKKIGGNIEDYKSSVNEILQYPKEKLLNLLQMSGYDIDLDQYYDYLKRSISIIDIEKLTNELEMDYCLLLPLTDNSKAIDIEKYYQINFDGAYEEKVNAMYCFGITFILLHELSHFTLGHLHKDEEITDETDADIAAFWEINGSLAEQRLFSAYCGLICVLFSLLYLNPDMIEDGIHPREDKRIFDIYENIKDEKYDGLSTPMPNSFYDDTYNRQKITQLPNETNETKSNESEVQIDDDITAMIRDSSELTDTTYEKEPNISFELDY